jgi:hypothetical protein
METDTAAEGALKPIADVAWTVDRKRLIPLLFRNRKVEI